MINTEITHLRKDLTLFFESNLYDNGYSLDQNLIKSRNWVIAPYGAGYLFTNAFDPTEDDEDLLFLLEKISGRKGKLFGSITENDFFHYSLSYSFASLAEFSRYRDGINFRAIYDDMEEFLLLDTNEYTLITGTKDFVENFFDSSIEQAWKDWEEDSDPSIYNIMINEYADFIK